MRLLYLALDGRYDLGFPVKQLSRYLQAPTKEQWARLRRVGRYLCGHMNYETLIPVEGSMEVCYADTDSDWAADLEHRKSTSCGLLDVGGAIQGMYVRGQDTIATSSGVAEFLAAGSVVNEGLGLVGVYEELGFPMTLILRLDSTAAIGMIQRRGTGRVRHIDVRHLHLQELIRDGRLGGLEKLPTADNRADMGTKVHPADRLSLLMDLMGMFSMDERKMISHLGSARQDGEDAHVLVQVLERLRDAIAQLRVSRT